MNREILRLAVPNIISNITVPLMGIVSSAVAGHLDNSAATIGALAIGVSIFNFIYWNCSFVRMGTSGLTAQAFGAGNFHECTNMLVRGILVAAILGLLVICFQNPLGRLALWAMNGNEIVHDYFYARIWAVPAGIMLFGLNGWFIGMQNSRFPMYIAITQNIVNIVASLCFVYLLDMKVAGVAAGTLIAQYAGFFMALWLYMHYYHTLHKRIVWKEIIQRQAMYRFFQVNRDIFFRTLCLVMVTMFFTSAGAAQGEVVLAVNTLLMQLFTLFSYVMDGFAYAGEALAGRYIGAKNQTGLRSTVHHLFYWGLGLSFLFTLLYSVGGKSFLGLLTNDISVIAASDSYFYWALIIPLAGFSAFLWDGIFIGATATRQMLYSMLVASASFFGIYYGFHSLLGNHALWLAFLVYLSLRGIVQTFLGRQIMRKVIVP